jgi:hypothetical protein
VDARYQRSVGEWNVRFAMRPLCFDDGGGRRAMIIQDWFAYKDANEPMSLTLRAAEWQYIRDYIAGCHEAIQIPCACEDMHSSLVAFDIAVSEYSKDKLFDQSRDEK